MRRPSVLSSAQSRLQGQAAHLQVTSLQQAPRAGLTPQCLEFNKGCYRGLGLDTGVGGDRGRKGVPAWAWGTLASKASLAPSGPTSGTRMKGAQYYPRQRRGLAWGPFPGCPGNDCPQEQQVGRAQPAAPRGPMGSAW